MVVLKALDSEINNEELLEQFVLFLKVKLASVSKNIETAMSLGLGPKLISLLNCPLENIQYEVATIIAYVSISSCNTLIDINLPLKLSQMFCSGETSMRLKKQVLIGLSNIASDSIRGRDEVLKCKILNKVKSTIEDKAMPMNIKKVCGILVAGLCKGTPMASIAVISNHHIKP
jgi:hypothetical protein